MTREKKEIQEKAIQIMRGRLNLRRVLNIEMLPRQRDTNGNYRNRYRIYTTTPRILPPMIQNGSALIAAILGDRATKDGTLSTYRHIEEIRNDLGLILFDEIKSIGAYIVESI